MQGATVVLNEHQYGTATDASGRFTIRNLEQGWFVMEISYLGYEKYVTQIHFPHRQHIEVHMRASTHMLSEIEITDPSRMRQKEASHALVFADRKFIHENFAGSLMQSLSKIPGIGSMDIGSGSSKPVIRGLGFNRVVIAENGIKHEAQEWGADHGLEIDQHAVERIDIIKGPAALIFGANAIGGVIDLRQLSVPGQYTSGGSVSLSGKTNNGHAGSSIHYFSRAKDFYFRARFSTSDYGDYKVPTDSIEYMSYYFRLNDNKLRNTAGLERSGHFTTGYVNNGFASHFSVSNVFARSGFFANAHGLEIRNSSIDYDKSSRDIDLPSQQVNHLKVMSNTYWKYMGQKMNLDVAYQHNLRKEFSEAIGHGYMPVPPDSLERLYNKSTLSVNGRLKTSEINIHQLTTGFNAEYQYNQRGGWGFLLPEYKSWSGGLFLLDKIQITEQWIIDAGIRYDLGGLNIEAYSDWYESPEGGIYQFRQRAAKLDRTFQQFSWAIGSSYNKGNTTLRLNTGKSFRIPHAKELAANGMNYHMYRFEQGDSTLSAETSYQLDVGLSIQETRWSINISPFVNYFPNYIFMNPTPAYFEAQQVFLHQQSRVFRAGGEITSAYRLTRNITVEADLEYIYSLQLSGDKRGFSLPFSPPAASTFGLLYKGNNLGNLVNPSAGISLRVVAAQNNIVPPEKKTPGYQLIHLKAGTGIKWKKQIIEIALHVNNLLNTRYYDHTSFYRLIEVPGQGRNFSVLITMPF